MKFLPILLILLVLGIGAWFFINNIKPSSSTAAPGFRVGLSMDTLKEDRWKTDQDLFTKKVEALGGSVVAFVANGDDQTQISQIENLIAQKVDVLVIIPHNAALVAPIIAEAHKAGIKVISYDRLITEADVDLYVSFDNEKVGEMQAQGVLNVVSKGKFAYIGGAPTDNNSKLLKEGTMKILDPKIKSGDIKIVFDKFTDNWETDIAYKNLKTYLKTGTVDAVIAANDGTALGVVQALSEKNLAGKVPVSGQDAELSACQRIVQGTQTVTVYKPIRTLAEKAAEIAMDFALNKTVSTNTTVNNGKIEVPSVLLSPILVNKSNLDETVIKDGYHTRAEIYTK
jgi:D-xylose transport system substrate-binding protein